MSSVLAAPTLARASAPQVHINAGGRIFYDKRFSQARTLAGRLAAQYSGGGALTPINGDVTALWVNELRIAAARGPLALSGVTTESFYFCLQTLLQPHGLPVAQIERVGRDLQAWEIRTGVATKDGMV